MKKSTRNILLAVIVILLIVGGIITYNFYSRIFTPNVPSDLQDRYVQIPTGSSFEDVVTILDTSGFLLDTVSFRQIAEQMQYIRDPMRAGRYEIKPGWSNYELVGHLRSGEQATVKVVLTNERLLENVAAKVARFLEPDSTAFINAFLDKNYLQTVGYTPEDLMTLFIPNTYDFYWNTTPEDFIERMEKEHERFWSKDNRQQKAEALGLTPKEVYTLASIVEKETLRSDEKERMAGVYLNRLEQGMLLQADPTSVFATRDFDTPRVTDYHTKFDSPYNTYLYPGLPPGPITMASISSIDGVLNAEDHDFIFFCAKGDGSGYHAFAQTLAQHNQNAARYRANLRRRGLR